jgi:heme a synthase
MSMQKIKNNQIISRWLYLGVAMIIIQVLLGGVTRLTGSGLSITEWKPILGALPPMNDTDWNIAFDKYKQIGQFAYLNSDFTLADFKFIFFWEWLHRNWARVIGIVFFLPFLWFIYKRMIHRDMIPQFIIIFCIGALQGLVGWIMVASGLNQQELFVNYFKLATHFMTALLALAVVYWYALYFSKAAIVLPTSTPKYVIIKNGFILVLLLLIVQLTYGAFMAGLKAAAAAPTWPTINGSFVPDGVFAKSIYSHPIAVHFVHRNLAYLIAALVIGLCVWAAGIAEASWRKAVYWPMAFVIMQILLGIGSVLYANHPMRNAMGKFEWSAQLHQLCALFLLLSIVHLLYLMRKPKQVQQAILGQ